MSPAGSPAAVAVWARGSHAICQCPWRPLPRLRHPLRRRRRQCSRQVAQSAATSPSEAVRAACCHQSYECISMTAPVLQGVDKRTLLLGAAGAGMLALGFGLR